MGLSQTISTAVSAAFAAVGDLKRTVTYRQNVTANSQNYNPATGEVAAQWRVSSVTGILYDFKTTQIDNISVFASDKQLMLLAEDITFTPGLNDRVVIDGATWLIQNTQKDPAQVIWILHIRKA